MEIRDIQDAIIKNMAVKNRHTLEVNAVIEGNSYFGVCIFIGVAAMFQLEDEEVRKFLSIDENERIFMEQKFLSNLKDGFEYDVPGTTSKRFVTKVQLILNSLKHAGKGRINLVDIIKDKI
tara:strand:+ start:252 stop:614 length:363 start_codon:yes stop_codon:yes gene_type:complete